MEEQMPSIHIATPTGLYDMASWYLTDNLPPDVAAVFAQLGPRDKWIKSSLDDVLDWLASAPTTATPFGHWEDVLPLLKNAINLDEHELMRDPHSGFFILEPVQP
jgi:hypothetical protein